MSNAASLRVILVYNALVFVLIGIVIMFGNNAIEIIKESDYARLIGIFYFFIGVLSYHSYKFFNFNDYSRLTLLTMLCLNVLLSFSYYSIFQLEGSLIISMASIHFILALLFVIFYYRMKKITFPKN